MKTKNVVLIIAGVGIAGVGGYLAWKKYGTKEEAATQPATANTTNTTVVDAAKPTAENTTATVKAAAKSSLQSAIDKIVASNKVDKTSLLLKKIIGKNAGIVPPKLLTTSQQAIAGFNLLN